MKVELRDISKHYDRVRANDGISLTIPAGTICGILGENGAGKSTLMKILSGLTRRNGGRMVLDGVPADFASPGQAVSAGIGMLYQDPLDFPHLTVLENFMLGRRPGAAGRRKASRKRLDRLVRRLGFTLDPEGSVRRLTVGERQQLEILRLLDLGVALIILDEPTTGISSIQKDILFRALKQLAAEGRTVILVSHKLEDVEALCDRVCVLRRGRVAGEAARPFDADRLMRMMFGEPPAPATPLRKRPGPVLLEMRQAAASGGRLGLRPCSLTVHEGEVVGLAGLEGSGQGVFLRLAAGLRRPTSGAVYFGGEAMTRAGYHAFRRRGVAFLPASRLEEGLIAGMTISEHVALQDRGFWVRWSRAHAAAAGRITDFNVKGRPDSPVDALSGGNQQRLLLSFLPRRPRLLLLENPTRGLDVESVRWVWHHLQTVCGATAAVVFSSAELDEILTVADRVVVFFNGRVIKDVSTAGTDVQELGFAIAGRT